MSEKLRKVSGTAIQLLQTVQRDVETNLLPKDFWITLGMLYNAYQDEMQRMNESSAVSESPVDLSNTVVFDKPPANRPDMEEASQQAIVSRSGLKTLG